MINSLTNVSYMCRYLSLDMPVAKFGQTIVREMVSLTVLSFCRSIDYLKGPSQPHLCLYLHARIWLLYFTRSLSK